jgi:hypothetical protein
VISILRSRVVIEAKPHLSFLLGNFSWRHRASSTRSTPDVGPPAVQRVSFPIALKRGSLKREP